MAPDAGGMKNGGGASVRNGGARQMLKKGPWTAAEDAILMEYVKKHGEGNWNAVQRNSGLMRCGKSCRLRWANHLRPNLRKGAFSPEEERLIVELHAKLGNKWARMAAQLPGRTDNEIKNYWNTRLKRRQRAGLPIYPQEIQPQSAYHQNQLLIHRSSRSSSPLSAILSAPPPPHHPPKPAAVPYNTAPSIYDHMFDSAANLKSPAPPPAALLHPTHNSHFKFFANPLGLALTPSNKPHPFPSAVTVTPPLPKHFGGHGISNAPPLPIPSVLPFAAFGGVFGGPNMQERPSIQTPTPTTSSGITGSLYPAPSDDSNDYEALPDLSRNNSGLLEDLLHESHALARDVERTNKHSPHHHDHKGKQKSTSDEYEALMGNDPTAAVHEEVVLSFGYEGEAATKEANSPADDDILSLLDNFPLAVPVPDWYEDGGKGDLVNGQPLMHGGDAAAVRNHREVSKSSSTTTSEATMCWNNMPCIS